MHTGYEPDDAEDCAENGGCPAFLHLIVTEYYRPLLERHSFLPAPCPEKFSPAGQCWQIAQMIGYTTSSRFAELFKKSTGILPIEYRKIARQK